MQDEKVVDWRSGLALPFLVSRHWNPDSIAPRSEKKNVLDTRCSTKKCFWATVALIRTHKHCFIGKTDLSKYYPSLPLHPKYQQYVYVRDPRPATRWHGTGPPSDDWLAYRAA